MIEICFWVFIASAGILFIYYSLTLTAISRYKLPETQVAEVGGITIVIAAKNELENLQALVPVLLKQHYPDFEIIVVDDNSSDMTYEYGLELMNNEKRFRLIRIDNTPDHINNKKYALTLGIKAARFDHILLTDADCMPSGNQWIKEMSRGYSDENNVFVLGFSQYFKEPGFLNSFIRFETLLTAHSYLGMGLLGRPYMGVGRNLAYKKSFFLSKNGFGKHQKIVGGDDDLFVNSHATRQNTSVVLSPESVVFSYPEKNWSDYIRQKTRHMSAGRYYRKTDRVLLGIIAMSKIVFWVSLICAAFALDKLLFTGIALFLTMTALIVSLKVLKNKTNDETPLWSVVPLDIAYIFYYISIGLKVLFAKKIKWT